MAHNHALTDSNARYIIDPVTRTMKTENDQPVVIQYDHDSERLTFELPRYIDGHDATLCDKVRVHYINVDTVTKDQYRGLYDVRDLQVSPDDPEKAICSWVISRNATQYVGSLSFILRLACTDDDGEEVYGWSTAKYASLYVSEGINNDDAIVEEYADILTQWQRELVAAGGVKTVNGIRPDLSGNVNVEAIDWEVTETVNEGAEVYAERELAFTSKFTSLPNLGTALVEGEDYVVYWNGTDYPCKCFVDDGTLYLGNGALSAVFTVDTGEPFLIQSFGGTNGMIFKATRTEETVTVRICSAEIVQHKTVPKHQLPEDIGGVNVTGAQPGQLVVIKAVDENGKPTEWETVDRTHYEEVIENAVIFPETELDLSEGMLQDETRGLPLSPNSEYTVTWDGTQYKCVCVDMGEGAKRIGNLAMMGEDFENTGEPFLIMANQVATVVVTLEPNTHTLLITGKSETIHTLDEKYIDKTWFNTALEEKANQLTSEYEGYVNAEIFKTTNLVTVDLTTNGTEIPTDGTPLNISIPGFTPYTALSNERYVKIYYKLDCEQYRYSTVLPLVTLEESNGKKACGVIPVIKDSTSKAGVITVLLSNQTAGGNIQVALDILSATT